MADIAALIESFYADIWGAGSVADADRVLHPDLRFRGSVGLEKRGREGFREYLELVRGGFGNYRCEILDLVADGDGAAAKMRFSGTHRRAFLGFEPTGREIAWQGAAFFQMRDGMLADIWVLGDTDGLRAALGGGPAKHQVDVYWSLQSAYCYFLSDRLQELAARPDVDVQLKPVRPGVLRLPDSYRDRTALERAYFDADAARTAAFLGLSYAAPRPSPVEFLSEGWIAAPDQPRIDRVQRLLMAAIELGDGLRFLDCLTRMIWDGQTEGWDQGDHLDDCLVTAEVPPADAHRLIDTDPDRLDAQILRNEQDMYAAGHWGVPLMVWRGEAFYGQDRFDQLLWRIEES